ncbi:hypothetical protein [Geothrix sp. 21YS21S-2]|uniref:hypothetical protein n=1 Tax=Geothrix sp. 21YS21S-2 TaxID=3068893 RepID=UPI0027BADAF6|nr:hypothetical protein [Geothrix sp. 21YS21S-2]
MLALLELELRPLARATLATVALAGLVALGNGGGRWLDPALLGYLIASLFACFGVAYRYFTWLERPATGMYWRWTLRTLLTPRVLLRLPLILLDQLFLQRFIGKRSIRRWGAHALLAWGCLLAFSVTFPLVFGWVRFTSDGPNADRYQAWVLGLPAGSFPLGGFAAFAAFHILDLAAVMVITGCVLAFVRRSRDEGDTATQRFDLDILPLLLLIAVSVTGLLLTASETWLQGRNFGTLAYLHEMTVILMLLSLPFGKLFHIVQRPAQAGVKLYKAEGDALGLLPCRACATPFIRPNQHRDLRVLWKELGLEAGAHHLDLCPRCRRRLVMKAQSLRLGGAFDPFADTPVPVEPLES